MSKRTELTRLLDDPAPGLASGDPYVRRIAVAAAHHHPVLHARIVTMLATDSDPSVRRECAEVLGRSSSPPVAALEQALGDPVAEVREAATTALGEALSIDSVQQLIALAGAEDEDRLVREAAVAALGAIGDERARPVLLSLVAGAPPQIRRRCVAALSVFDGDDIEEALRNAAADRNPMVREAAEMVVGRSSS